MRGDSPGYRNRDSCRAQGMGHLDSCQQLGYFMDGSRNLPKELLGSVLLPVVLAR